MERRQIKLPKLSWKQWRNVNKAILNIAKQAEEEESPFSFSSQSVWRMSESTPQQAPISQEESLEEQLRHARMEYERAMRFAVSPSELVGYQDRVYRAEAALRDYRRYMSDLSAMRRYTTPNTNLQPEYMQALSRGTLHQSAAVAQQQQRQALSDQLRIQTQQMQTNGYAYDPTQGLFYVRGNR